MKNRVKVVRIFFILLAALIIFTPSYFRIFENFELATLDLRFKLRPVQPQNKDIAIIEIANDTLERLGMWPIKRGFHAAMIDVLSASGAKAIVFDMLFCEPREGDEELLSSTKKAGNVYYGFSFDSSLIPGLKESARGYGSINVTRDNDGKTRWVPLKIKYEDKICPQLAFLVASDYLGKRFSEIEVPLDEKSRILVNFAGKWHKTYRHYSYVDILKSYSLAAKGEKGAVDLNEFNDKICFIGLTATAAHDLNAVPVQERYPGLGIHVNIFNSIITQNFLRRASRVTNLLILILLAFITAFVTLKSRPLASSLFIILAIAVLSICAIAIFIFKGLWIDLFYPVVALFLIYLSLTFYKYVSEMQKRQLMEKELEVAQKIQRSFLPENPPEVEGVDIAAEMSPAKQVGGDLYDFVALEDGRLGIMVGDVSGKGVPAALYMAKAVSLFRLFSKTASGAKDAVTQLNEALTEESKTNLFITLSYLIYSPKDHSLTFSSGGHLPTLLLKHGEAKCRFLETKEGVPLGLMSGEFGEEGLSLSSGDILALYTDGVTEAMNQRREEFGQDRLAAIVEKNRTLAPQQLLPAITTAILQFCTRTPQHDDLTLIIIKIT